MRGRDAVLCCPQVPVKPELIVKFCYLGPGLVQREYHPWAVEGAPERASHPRFMKEESRAKTMQATCLPKAGSAETCALGVLDWATKWEVYGCLYFL